MTDEEIIESIHLICHKVKNGEMEADEAYDAIRSDMRDRGNQ